MEAFSFVFSLYSIILGLALTEVFRGAARVLKARRKMRTGWLTGLLAATLVAEITLFWRLIWGTRLRCRTRQQRCLPELLFAGSTTLQLHYYSRRTASPAMILMLTSS